MADVTLPGTGSVVRSVTKSTKEAQVVILDLGGAGDESLLTSSLPVTGVNLAVTSAISGVVTVTTAGTAVQGSSIALTNGVYIRALSTNTNSGYVGNDGAGDVASTNGFELTPGTTILIQVDNLNKVWFDTAANGEKFCWLKA